MNKIVFFFYILSVCTLSLRAQTNYIESVFKDRLLKDEITQKYITPEKIVWMSDKTNNLIKNSEELLNEFDGQLTTSRDNLCHLKSDSIDKASLLLDYGAEIYGGIEITSGIRTSKRPLKVRIRFGESVTEAMSNSIDNSKPGLNSATNDHSLRDFTIDLPWLGSVVIGNSGFRFVRIDLLDTEEILTLKSIRAIIRYRDIPYLGSFKCDNERLNKIWDTGAYTVHLNMQEYLWDGIKRDRLVWVGDMHPEVQAINTVFGKNDVVKRSLDFARDTTPLPGWMNTISSYSLWWIIIHRDLYMHQGDLFYLKEQHNYLKALIQQIIPKISNGKENLDGGRFLDWPTSEYNDIIHSGLQALTIMSLKAGEDIASWLNDEQLKKVCHTALSSMNNYTPSHQNNKQAAALLSIANVISPSSASEVLLKNGANDFATFYGYYMLEALAKDGKYKEAIDIISEYWGAMLDLGATTFWENFIFEEGKNAARIDELVPETKYDIHADGGKYCYIGLRGSLCHGWASGPTAWLTEHILGIKVIEPGAKKLQIKPNLGNLSFVEGSYPTPFGVVYVKHVKQVNGMIKTSIKAPKGIKIIR